VEPHTHCWHASLRLPNGEYLYCCCRGCGPVLAFPGGGVEEMTHGYSEATRLRMLASAEALVAAVTHPGFCVRCKAPLSRDSGSRLRVDCYNDPDCKGYESTGTKITGGGLL